MVTLRKMQENILRRKLSEFFLRNLKKMRKRQEWGLCFEHLPRNTIARCMSLHNKITKEVVGFDIIVSSYYLQHYPHNLESYKRLILHELAHTHGSARGMLRKCAAGHGHDMVFRKTARRFGCGRDFSQSYCYVNSGGDTC